ncbi:hypothetical protein C9890_0219 [Perkinsus sp. BL_2016]|nr:hypothetical protein C9890_0219 [Perkinsus sp. BL_2016]
MNTEKDGSSSKWYNNKKFIIGICIGIALGTLILLIIASTGSNSSGGNDHKNSTKSSNAVTFRDADSQISAFDLSEMIFFQKTNSKGQYELFSVRPDGTELTLHHNMEFNDWFAVSENGKTLIYAADEYTTLMLVDLTKELNSEAIELFKSDVDEPIITFSISSDGSRIFFSSKKLDSKTFHIYSIELDSNSQIPTLTLISEFNDVDIFLSPSSGNNFIFYIKVTPSDIDGLMKSEICRLEINLNGSVNEACERFGTESRLLSSSPDGNHFAYTCISDGSKIFIAEFGDLGQGTRDNHIYLSFVDNSGNRLLHALNHHTGSVNLITDQYELREDRHEFILPMMKYYSNKIHEYDDFMDIMGLEMENVKVKEEGWLAYDTNVQLTEWILRLLHKEAVI